MNFHRWLQAVTLACACVAANAAAPLDATIADYAKRHDFHGSVLVDQGGERIYARSFGLAERAFQAPAGNDTRFRIASITKLFTATLILQLHEQGRIDLQAPIASALPDYRGEGAATVTVHQLLNHTSGLKNFDTVTSYEEAARKGLETYQLPHDSDELVRRYCSGPLAHEAGSTFDYNNADYILLGKIVEKASGKSFEAALQERILEPLGLRATGMPRQQTIVRNLAATYFRPDPSAALINDMPAYIENWYAAGGMVSTTGDLATFAAALFGGKLLKPESLRAMLKPGLDDYGYGIWIADAKVGERKTPVAHRPGRIMGANTVLLRYLDEDVTVVILGNTNLADLDAFAFLIGKTLIR